MRCARLDVPNLGIHTLWRFPCASFHSLLLLTSEKKGACFRRSVKVRLLKTLAFGLRCAVAIQSSLSLPRVAKAELHNTHDALIT